MYPYNRPDDSQKPKPKRKAKRKPGRNPNRQEIYLRPEVRKTLDKNRKRDGKRGKPLPKSTYIARLIVADASPKPTEAIPS